MDDAVECGFVYFEHTADVGMRVWGRTLEELFQQASLGLVSLWVESGSIQAKQTRFIRLHASSVSELLRMWLTELIGRFDIDQFVPAKQEFLKLTETQMVAQIEGEPFDPSRHISGVEVKGVTRHQFDVSHRHNRWEAQLIFDV